MRSFFIQLQASEDLAMPLEISFEELLAALERLPRMFVEMDGSWVWRGDGAGKDECWQLDGMVYDHLGKVRYLELKGNCEPSMWRQLLSCLRWPEQTLLVHHVDVGQFETLENFEKSYIGN
jgi:hypothetical protein